jgi:hypothetical protein
MNRPKRTASSDIVPKSLEDLNKITVSLEVNSVGSAQALVELLSNLHVNYDFAPEFYRPNFRTADGGIAGGPGVKPTLNLPARTITMRLENVRLPKALNSLTKAIGIRWTAEGEDGSVVLHFLPGDTTLQELPVPSNGGGLGGGGFGGGSFGGGGFGGGNDPNALYIITSPTRIKVDAHDVPVRTVLRQWFETAKGGSNLALSFAVDEEVPQDLKVNLVFENLRLKTALDALCQSAGLGWRTEGVPNGLLIRISKRYAEPVNNE